MRDLTFLIIVILFTVTPAVRSFSEAKGR